MTDVLYLRTLGVCCNFLMVLFNHFRSPPIAVAVCFNALFVGINAVFIAQILQERLEVSLFPSEEVLWESCFKNSSITKAQMAQIFRNCGEEKVADKNAKWSNIGEAVPRTIVFVVSGSVDIMNERGECIASIGPGDVLGERGYIAEYSEHSTATVSTVFDSEECTVYIELDAYKLRAYLDARRELNLSFEALLALQVSHKLSRMKDSAAESAYAHLLLGLLSGRDEVTDSQKAWVSRFSPRRRKTGGSAADSATLQRYESAHEWALAKAGWTSSEYEAGCKVGHKPGAVNKENKLPRKLTVREMEEARKNANSVVIDRLFWWPGEKSV